MAGPSGGSTLNSLQAIFDHGRDALLEQSLKVAETEVTKRAGHDIEVRLVDIPPDWKDWVMKTGINSICHDRSWDFLEEVPQNSRRRGAWEKYEIENLNMTVNESPDEEVAKWKVVEVLWEEGSLELTVVWYPCALRWESENSFLATGRKRYWCLRDDIIFRMGMYRLSGKCFYKSDWMDGFEDVDPDDPDEDATKTYKRWFQFRHWCILWFAEAMPGWNYQNTAKLPPCTNGEPFSLSHVLSLQTMPGVSMPKIKLPTVPDFPVVALPPPQQENAETNQQQSRPKTPPPAPPGKRQRPKAKYACHGVIDIKNMKVKTDGPASPKIILSGLTIVHFWADGPDGNGVRMERKAHQRLELECLSPEQAESWRLSLMIGGSVEEGEESTTCSGCVAL